MPRIGNSSCIMHAPSSPDAVDVLPAALWLRIFHHLHLPPSHPNDPAIRGQRHTPHGLASPIIEHTGARDLELFSIYAPPGCEQSGDPAGVSFEAPQSSPQRHTPHDGLASPIIERTGARDLERFSIYMSPSSGSEQSGDPAGSTQSGGSSDQLTDQLGFDLDCEPLWLRDEGLTASEQWGDPAGSTRSEISDHLTGVDLDCEPVDSRCEGGNEEGGSEEGGSEEGGTEDGSSEEGGSEEGGTEEGGTEEGGTEEGGTEEGGTEEGGTGEGPTAFEQYEKNAHAFGASWPLLCCALASKRLLNLVIAFSTIRFFLAHPGLHSLHLRFSNPEQLPTLGTCIARCSPSLSSLRLELQGAVDFFKEQQNEHWTLGFLRTCGQLRELNLGRGMWVLNRECVDAACLKSVRSLTLERVAFKNVSFQVLDSISPQLHEFTLYEDHDLRLGPRLASHTLALSFPNARLLRFRFASSELKLTLTVSPALKTLSVMAKRLVLSCKSAAPLALHHLSLYGQERLDISSLRLASVRVAYLDGPGSDQEGFSRAAYLDGPNSDSENSFWTECLGTIAPTVEVLIVRHGVPIEKVDAEWTRLHSLGIVVHTKGTHVWDREATVDNLRFLTDDVIGGYCNDEEDEEEDDHDWDTGDDDDGDWYEQALARYGAHTGSRHKVQPDKNKVCAKPPTLCAPNLRFLFFPSSKACDAPTLAALRQDYPALALYCVVDRSFYWERKGVPVSNGPLEHVRAGQEWGGDDYQSWREACKEFDMLPAPIWFRIFHLLHQPPFHLDEPAILAQRETFEHPAAMAERLAAREVEWFRTPGFTASSAGLTAWGQMGHPAGSAAHALQMFHTAFGQPGHPASSAGLTGQPGHPASNAGLAAQLDHPANSTGLTAWQAQGLPANSSTGLTSQLGQLGHPANSAGLTGQLGQMGHPAGSAAHALQMFHAEFGQPGASSAGLTAWDRQGDPASSAQRGTGTGTGDHLTNTKVDRDHSPVVFLEEGLTASEQHKENADTYGASCALLCCALASKRLLNLVVAFSESQPISLRYDDQNPHWSQTVRFFLSRPGLHSLDLRFSPPEHLPTLGACIARSSRSLASLRLESQVPVGLSKHQEKESWSLGFLSECAQLQELNLGRGMWKLNRQCVGVNVAWLKSIRKLTLEQVHFGSLSFQLLQSITPQLHEFTLYEDGNVLREHPRVASTTRLAFSFPIARLLRFRFASTELHLTLTVPPSLETLSVMAKRLVLSCKSTAPLALHHLSLYSQERLVISSLRLASARVAYLDGPANDQEGFSWTEWLGTIAPTVEVLIVRHGVPIKKVEAEWGRLRSLGIVVPPWDRSACVNNWGMGTDEGECEEHLDDGRSSFSWADEPEYFGSETDEDVDEDDYIFDDADEDEDDDDDDDNDDDDDEDDDDDDNDDDDDDDDHYGGVYGVGGFGGDDYDRQFWAMYGPAINAKIRARKRLMKAVFKPPSIRAPNLLFLFFPTRKACNTPTLAALRQDYPALALYCVVDRSFYWHRKGVPVSNGPLEHVRRAKSGVWDEEEGEKRPKKVREKMHSVNRRVVEGYCAGEDQVYVLQYQ
ncbi:unnamed protein product [Closterium sp. Naga37s-1]|nr:unnamed protein product [Closterium sp. Naga37s-1]